MTPSCPETIVALATAPGRSGVAIVRVSGALAYSLVERICKLKPKPRYNHFAKFYGKGEVLIDEGLVSFFPGPNSFTGEDVAEFHCHGSMVVVAALQAYMVQQGARLAEPGEFSKRAFLNHKLDLTQAEAIADLIDASSVQGAQMALQSLQGVFSKQVDAIVSDLTQLRVYIEASLDFSEEDIDFISDGDVAGRLDTLVNRTRALLDDASSTVMMQQGLQVVLLGKPNVGKSSLLNALLGDDRAIVTDQAGTTRDVIQAKWHCDGVPLEVLDTAGLHHSSDQIEQEGIRRTKSAAAKANMLLVVLDSSADLEQELASLAESLALDLPMLVIANKCDLSNEKARCSSLGKHPLVYISAKHGDGVALLKQAIFDLLGYQCPHEGQFMARARHVEALELALKDLHHGQEVLRTSACELLAQDLYQAQQYLGSITGQISADDLLGEIFSSFCIGK